MNPTQSLPRVLYNIAVLDILPDVSVVFRHNTTSLEEKDKVLVELHNRYPASCGFNVVVHETSYIQWLNRVHHKG